ncbi:MAG: hypothetical protein ACXVPD_06310, partial [Bacteroidia bacterium]
MKGWIISVALSMVVVAGLHLLYDYFSTPGSGMPTGYLVLQALTMAVVALAQILLIVLLSVGKRGLLKYFSVFTAAYSLVAVIVFFYIVDAQKELQQIIAEAGSPGEKVAEGPAPPYVLLIPVMLQ